MLLEIYVLILTVRSSCPKYSLSINPTRFIESVNLMTFYHDNQFEKYRWPTILVVSCVDELTTSAGIKWYNTVPNTYTDNNKSYIQVTQLSANYILRERPTCQLTTNNHVCMYGHTYPLYIPRISILHGKYEKLDACVGQGFAVKIIDFSRETKPFVPYIFDDTICRPSGVSLVYDTMLVDSVSPNLLQVSCKIGHISLTHTLNLVPSSPNCVGSPQRILFPRNNSELYNGNNKDGFQDLTKLCFPSNDAVLRDSVGRKIRSIERVLGKRRYSCEIMNDYYSRIFFDVITPTIPNITKPLEDCQRCDNKCVFSFDYNPGMYAGPVEIEWFFNGENLEDTFLATISEDRKTATMDISPGTAGNIQVIFKSRYGTHMTTAFTQYTRFPSFVTNFPKYYINSSNKVFSASVDFSGVDAVKMWFKANGKPLNSSNPNAKTSVDLVTHNFTIEVDNTRASPPIDSFSAVFQAGSCVVESVTCSISTSEKIRSTVSLMIPVLGILGAAVLLAIILIPICVVYRNRNSRAYRLAMVERQCGLNPDKDFKTLSEFGENSRRNPRTQPFSILPSAPGSNEGSWAPLNNMPDVKEQVSFVNEY